MPRLKNVPQDRWWHSPGPCRQDKMFQHHKVQLPSHPRRCCSHRNRCRTLPSEMLSCRGKHYPQRRRTHRKDTLRQLDHTKPKEKTGWGTEGSPQLPLGLGSAGCFSFQSPADHWRCVPMSTMCHRPTKPNCGNHQQQLPPISCQLPLGLGSPGRFCFQSPADQTCCIPMSTRCHHPTKPNCGKHPQQLPQSSCQLPLGLGSAGRLRFQSPADHSCYTPMSTRCHRQTKPGCGNYPEQQLPKISCPLPLGLGSPGRLSFQSPADHWRCVPMSTRCHHPTKPNCGENQQQLPQISCQLQLGPGSPDHLCFQSPADHWRCVPMSTMCHRPTKPNCVHDQQQLPQSFCWRVLWLGAIDSARCWAPAARGHSDPMPTTGPSPRPGCAANPPRAQTSRWRPSAASTTARRPATCAAPSATPGPRILSLQHVVGGPNKQI